MRIETDGRDEVGGLKFDERFGASSGSDVQQEERSEDDDGVSQAKADPVYGLRE
jgi:hypothetical protein